MEFTSLVHVTTVICTYAYIAYKGDRLVPHALEEEVKILHAEICAGLILLLSLLLALAGLVITPLLAISGVGLIIALLVGLAAFIPSAIAWQFNRSQT
jgi:hypothetical protein